jgi:ParB family chromosome partitioning protein
LGEVEILSDEHKIENVSVDEIILDPETQVRMDKSTGIPELATDIEKNGLRYPIELRLDNEGQKHLTIGSRRLAAFILLKRKEIPAEIKKITAKEAIIHTISENVARNNLTPREEGLLLKAAIEKHGWTVPELAVKYAKSREAISEKKRWIEDRLALLGLDIKVQNLVSERKIGITIAKKMTELPPERQVQVSGIIVSKALDQRNATMEINDQLAEVQEEEELKKVVEKSQFKKCPTCALPPTGFIQSSREKVQCKYNENYYDPKHIWSLRTGKTKYEEYKAEEEKQEANAPQKKEPPPLTRSFRYNVPVDKLNEALIAFAVNEAIQYLKKHGAQKSIRLGVDDHIYGKGFSLNVDKGELSVSIHLPGFGYITFEPQKYQDGVNLTKVSPSHEFSSQRRIDEENEKLRKKLNSLPEIAKYLKTHKNQKKL